jgi:hypothetical protein
VDFSSFAETVECIENDLDTDKTDVDVRNYRRLGAGATYRRKMALAKPDKVSILP